MNRKIWIFTLFLLLCVLSGCDRTVSGQGQENTAIDITAAELSLVSIAQNAQETEELSGDGICISRDTGCYANGGDNEKEIVILESVVRNAENVFLRVSYSEPMAQYSYRNQLYIRHLQQEEQSLIYDTSEAYWMNEVRANDDYLYWVEYISISDTTDVCFKVMQYQMDNGNISCIAQRDASESLVICLEVSERFLTWYDISPDNRVEIVVFDIEKQEFRQEDYAEDIQGGFVTIYAPYERLDIVEDCITYFLEDELGQLYIRRENLRTGQKTTLLLGDKKAYPKLAGCFSDGQYIGWHTEYGEGSYLIYDMDSGKLYSWDVKEDGIHVFSSFFLNGKLYFNNNNSEDNGLYVWDLAAGQVYRQDLGDGYSLQLRQYKEDSLALEVQYEDRVELVDVCSDNLTFQ